MKRFILCIICIILSLSMASCGIIDRLNGSKNEEGFIMQENQDVQINNSQQVTVDFHAVVGIDDGWMKADSLSYVMSILEDRGLSVPQSLAEYSLESYENYLDGLKNEAPDEKEETGKGGIFGGSASAEKKVYVESAFIGVSDDTDVVMPVTVMGVVGEDGKVELEINGGNVVIGGSGGSIGTVGGDGSIGNVIIGGNGGSIGIVGGTVGNAGGWEDENDGPFAVMFIDDARRYMDIDELLSYMKDEITDELQGAVIVLCRHIGDEAFWGGKLVQNPDGEEQGECEHNWTQASPDQVAFCSYLMEVCTLCGEFRGEMRGCEYTGVDYSCTEAPNCIHCGKPYENYEIPGHSWIEASCEHPRICEMCQATEGEALGHYGGEAGCLTYAVCERCGRFYGDMLGHNYVDGVCTHCNRSDPDAVVVPDNSDVKISHFGPIPFQLHTAKIESAKYEVEGTSIFVTVTIRKTIGDGDVDFGWILYGGGYDDLCKGNETTPYLKQGESVNYLFEIPNAITSEFNSYKVYLGYGYN